ncbi:MULTISPECIES: hypothetical protein [Streptomyces]|uniref:Uncharacterized protein n=1 Tax=Streptomyces lonegramiae TaxID=3075524 RepID=A0ABU2XPE5_9ACTN|nr:hypothetical protein [Streptomyces sp. DSM 41529]MDT0547786.1 hypothetical protein [Streptomyces sp. DSM 41529]
MLHHEFQAARQAAVLARAAQRRLVREAERDARAAVRTTSDSRKRYFLRSRHA